MSVPSTPPEEAAIYEELVKNAQDKTTVSADSTFDDNIDMLSEVNIDGLAEDHLVSSPTKEGDTSSGGPSTVNKTSRDQQKSPKSMPKDNSDGKDLMQLRTRLVELCLKKRGEFEEMAYICQGLINWTQRQTFLAAVSDRNNVESLVALLEGVIDDPDPRVEPQMRYQRALSRLMTFDNMRKRLIDDESARRVTSCSLCNGFHTRSSVKCTEKDY